MFLSGLSVIVKKELSDAMSNKTYLLAVVILLLIAVFVGVTSAEAYSRRQVMTGDTIKGLILIWNLVPQVRLFNSLIAIAFGFNAINKERTEGSLKVLLSYPLYRDQVIFGKLVAGLLLVGLITTLSLSLSVGIYLFASNIVLTYDFIARLLIFSLLSFLLLSGYLGLGMLLSILFNDPKTALITAFLFLGVFNSEAFMSFGLILARVLYGPFVQWSTGGLVDTQVVGQSLQNLVSIINPQWSYTFLSTRLGFMQVQNVVNGVVEGYIDVDWKNVLMNNVNCVAVLILTTIMTFAACYALFTRRDVF